MREWKGLLVKIIMVSGLTLLFSLYGFLFGVGVLVGREVSQCEYRFFEKGHRWDEITWKVYLDVENWKSRKGGLVDTLSDVLVPFIVGIIVLFVRNNIGGR